MRKFPRKGLWIAAVLSLLIPVLVHSYDSGSPNPPPPAGYTGGFGEPICTECHVGTALNGGAGKVSISVATVCGAPANFYASAVPYRVTVNVSDPAQQKWGFELSARTTAGKQAGNITVGSDGFTQILKSFNGIQYIAHTFRGTRNGTKSGVDFSFNWTAPNVSSGPVVFNAAGNAANGDGTNIGDHIYSTFLTLPAQPLGLPPVVPASSVVNNASFASGNTPLAPGTIAAIFGSNLDDGSTNSFSCLGSDGKLATVLGSANVTFNGNLASPVFSALPGQLNVQIPQELAGSTSATVQVTVNGQTSPTQIVPIGDFSPGIFTIPSGGSGQGAILIANSAPPTFAAPSGAISGSLSRPANIGEFVTIFATGLGSVTNPPGTGVPASGTQLSTTTTTPEVTIGGVAATTISFSGLAPGFVGLYQVNVQIPPGVPTGNAVPLQLSIGGIPSNAVTLAIGAP